VAAGISAYRCWRGSLEFICGCFLALLTAHEKTGFAESTWARFLGTRII